tara:strand:+ start:148 stop:897 length:750 start_codon:yes stop_codon:yes gene_type:complete
MFDVDMWDVSTMLGEYAHEIGETTEQGTIRFGVAVSRELAKATNPLKSTAGSRKKNAAAQMRKVVEPMGARDFNKLRKQAKPRVKLGGQWYAFDKRRLIESDRQLWDIIENNRVQGKTRKLPRDQRYICKQSDYNKVATRRAKLWGAAKGAWIGAGQRLARTQSGLDRINIGKNFLGWAHRHTDKGRGRQQGKDHSSIVYLVNNTTGAAKDAGLSPKRAHLALHHARKALFKYYGKRLRSMKVKGKGGK